MKAKPPRFVALFTDFGPAGPYLGQLEAVIYQFAAKAKVINLVSDAPIANPQSSAYLLAALANTFAEPTVFLAVVDPGVGGERLPVMLKANNHYFVGPDNGLLNTIAAQVEDCQWWRIIWHPDHCSYSFHGRDLFAPIAADLINGCTEGKLVKMNAPDSVSDWPGDLSEVIYFDHFGNAMTGLRFQESMQGRTLWVNDHSINQAQTFCRVSVGEAFWYCNSCGLVEIAVNRGRAQNSLQLNIGVPVSFA